MKRLISNIKTYVQTDWKTNPVRLVLEMLNWILNIVSGVIIAATVPDTPLLVLYPIWFTCVGITLYSALTRGSTGIVLASISILLIDVVGFARVLLH